MTIREIIERQDWGAIPRFLGEAADRREAVIEFGRRLNEIRTRYPVGTWERFIARMGFTGATVRYAMQQARKADERKRAENAATAQHMQLMEAA